MLVRPEATILYQIPAIRNLATFAKDAGRSMDLSSYRHELSRFCATAAKHYLTRSCAAVAERYAKSPNHRNWITLDEGNDVYTVVGVMDANETLKGTYDARFVYTPQLIINKQQVLFYQPKTRRPYRISQDVPCIRIPDKEIYNPIYFTAESITNFLAVLRDESEATFTYESAARNVRRLLTDSCIVLKKKDPMDRNDTIVLTELITFYAFLVKDLPAPINVMDYRISENWIERMHHGVEKSPQILFKHIWRSIGALAKAGVIL